ncbi:MAG: M28 family peptidase [Bacteroidales bacterium]|nr:M28 family peptidase [Bacteroidales bacterium]
MKHRIIGITILLLLNGSFLMAQDPVYYRSVIRELSSKKYEGRSDFGNGDKKAAKFLVREFKKMEGIEPALKDGYLQPFSYGVNVFHKKMEMSIDGEDLEPGRDFIVREFSPSVKGSYALAYISGEDHHPERLLPLLETGKFKDSYIVLNFNLIYKYLGIAPEVLYSMPLAGLIMVRDGQPSFFKSRSGKRQPIPVIWASPQFPKNAKKITVRFESRWIENYSSSNVIARLPGLGREDSCIVFIAHYDHLGHFGKDVYYPGANDNASGTAFLLTLAGYFAKPENRPDLTYIFIAAAAEENNLLGSTFYTQNPVVPLEKTLQVINLDMVADNGDRLFVETGPEGEASLLKFKELNNRLNLFGTIEQHPLSNDSDHYPFAMRKVPALYIMVDGDAYSVYHTPLDDYHHIYTNRYSDLFRLVTEFARIF